MKNGSDFKDNRTFSTTTVAVFLKTPGFTPLKTRLAATIGEKAAVDFFLHSTTRVFNAITEFKSRTGARFAIALCEHESAATQFWTERSSEIDTVIWQGNGDLGTKMARVWQQLAKETDCVLLVGADAPQLSGDILHAAEQVMIKTNGGSAVFGPAYDGGFYLLGIRGFTPVAALQSITYSTPQVLSQLSSAFPKDVLVTYLPLLRDIDTGEDLKAYQG